MQADLDDFPDQGKLLGRRVRRGQHMDAVHDYERRHRLDERSRQVLEDIVRERLESDLPACELLLCLFASALRSSRRSGICDPFPPIFTGPNGPLYDEVDLWLRAFPNLSQLRKSSSHLRNLPLKALQLLDWIINAERDGFTVKSVDLVTFLENVASKTSKRRQQAHTRPSYVFELVYHTGSERYMRFQEQKERYGALMGHHGSPLENFHSITRFGLDESYGRASSIYGEGIYLSADREVAFSFLQWSKHGLDENMKLSHLGEKLGLMTCTEVIKEPNQVRHDASSPSTQPRNALLDPTEEELPPGYIISKSSQLVLTKYLLVFSESTGKQGTSSESQDSSAVEQGSQAPNSGFDKIFCGRASGCRRSVIVQCLLALVYVFILLSIWYSKGKPNTRWLSGFGR